MMWNPAGSPPWLKSFIIFQIAMHQENVSYGWFGRVETAQKNNVFIKYKWRENGVSMNNEPDRHHDKCLPVLKPMPLVTNTQIHKHTNTQLHNYSKNTQMSSSFETYHPGPPEEFLPRIKTGDS